MRRIQYEAEIITLETLAGRLADFGMDTDDTKETLEDTLSLICDRLTLLHHTDTPLFSKEN